MISQQWFGQWLCAPRFIVKWNLANKFHRNLNPNTTNFLRESRFGNVAYKTAASIFSLILFNRGEWCVCCLCPPYIPLISCGLNSGLGWRFPAELSFILDNPRPHGEHVLFSIEAKLSIAWDCAVDNQYSICSIGHETYTQFFLFCLGVLTTL